jgi:hypothetical protein
VPGATGLSLQYFEVLRLLKHAHVSSECQLQQGFGPLGARGVRKAVLEIEEIDDVQLELHGSVRAVRRGL